MTKKIMMMNKIGEIDESKITQLYDWWKVPANNYSGEVTVTVSAQ